MKTKDIMTKKELEYLIESNMTIYMKMLVEPQHYDQEIVDGKQEDIEKLAGMYYELTGEKYRRQM